MALHQERIPEEEKIRLARSIFSSPDFQRLFSELLYDMEAEAVQELRGNRGSSEDHILTIRVVDRFRTTIRALAAHAGVTHDPIRREI